MKCENCKFYEAHCNEEERIYRKLPGKCCENIKDCASECRQNDIGQGFCCRFPPSHDTEDGVLIPITVCSDGWCGEFLPK